MHLLGRDQAAYPRPHATPTARSGRIDHQATINLAIIRLATIKLVTIKWGDTGMPQIRIKSGRPRLLPSALIPSFEPQPMRPVVTRQPLTHHEILALMAPFTHRGLHADMAASRREDRVLCFKPRELPADDDCPVPLAVQLRLEAAQGGRRPGKHRLVRLVRAASGLESSVIADGKDLENLLEQLDQVPVRRQFAVHAGVLTARSYVLESVAELQKRGRGGGARWGSHTVGGRLLQKIRSRLGKRRGGRLRRWRQRLPWRKSSGATAAPRLSAEEGAAAATEPAQVPTAGAAGEDLLIETEDGPLRPVIVATEACVGQVRLELKAERFNGLPAELKLTTEAGSKLKLPEDLLAVIGWHHRPLRQIVSYWRGFIRVAPKEPARTAEIERELGRTVTHLAKTLAEPPARFHQRHAGARWRVAYQRALPLLLLLGLSAATPGIRYLELADDSVLKLLIFHAPPLMLLSFFLMREMPRFEIPPLPRPLVHRDWVQRVADKKAPPAPANTGAASSDRRRDGFNDGLKRPAAEAEG